MSVKATLVFICAASLLSSASLFISVFNNSSEVLAAEPAVVWSRFFGGSANDAGQSIVRTSDGGYVVAGFTESYGSGDRQVWLLKANSNGVESWNRTYGGGTNDGARCVQQTSDGGYVISGTLSESACLLKTDAGGNEVWRRAYGEGDGYFVQQTDDGGYVLGSYNPYGESFSIKADSLGNESWRRSYGGHIKSGCQTTDGGFILAGQFAGTAWLVKTDSSGAEVWSKTFGEGSGSSVRQTSDGGYVMVGNGGLPSDTYLIRADADGELLWQRSFGESLTWEMGYTVQETDDGGYIIGGQKDTGTYTGAWLLKADAEGNEMWSWVHSVEGEGQSAVQAQDGAYVIAGWGVPVVPGDIDMTLTKVSDSLAGVLTATGTGMATLVPSSGSMQNLTAVSLTSLPPEAIATQPPGVEFPHGFFEFEITGLTPGQSVTLTITLPSAVPVTAQYWKYGPTPSVPSGEWYQIFMGDNDGDNVITITLTDGGLGDDDLTANGTIVDQGGPGWPGGGGGGGGGSGVPAFPSIYIGIGAALGVGVLAYFLRRRMVA